MLNCYVMAFIELSIIYKSNPRILLKDVLFNEYQFEVYLILLFNFFQRGDRRGRKDAQRKIFMNSFS